MSRSEPNLPITIRRTINLHGNPTRFGSFEAIFWFSPILCYLVRPRPKYSPQHPIHNTLGLRSSINVSDQVSHPYKTKGKIIVLFIFIFKC